jgi:hypothetical protein
MMRVFFQQLAVLFFLVAAAGVLYAQDDYDAINRDIDNFINGGNSSGNSGANNSNGGSRTAANDTPAAPSAAQQAQQNSKPSWMESEDAEVAGPMRGERLFEIGVPAAVTVTSREPLEFIKNITGALDGNFGPLLASSDELRAGVFGAPLTLTLRVLNLLTVELFTGFEMTLNSRMDPDIRDALQTLVKIADGNADYADIKSIDGKNGRAKVGMGSFFEIGGGVSSRFLNNKIYLRAAPSIYFPLFYAKEGTLNFNTASTPNSGKVTADADFALWTPFAMNEPFSAADIFKSPGADLTVEGRLAIWRVLEAGAVITHIPVIPASTNYTMKAQGLLDLSATLGGGGIKDESTLKFDKSSSERNTIIRPVRFDLFALLKPFETTFVYIKPNFGWTFAPLVKPAIPVNFGLEAGVNLPILLSASLGTSHTDGLWEHALRLTVDFRFIELSLLGALSGPDFVTNGLTVGVSLKTGF